MRKGVRLRRKVEVSWDGWHEERAGSGPKGPKSLVPDLGTQRLEIVIGYFLLYPILICSFEDFMALPYWVDDFIGATVFPLEWLCGNSRWYHRYIEFLGKLLQR